MYREEQGMTPHATSIDASRPRRRISTAISLVALMGVAALAWRMMPAVRHASGQLTTVGAPSWPWLGVAAVAIAASFCFSALALQAGVGVRLPFRHTVFAQLAAGAANRITPGSVGGAAVNLRFLTKQGISVGTAGAAVTLVGLAHAAVALLGILIFGPSTIPRAAGRIIASPTLPWVLVIVAALLALFGSWRWKIGGSRFAVIVSRWKAAAADALGAGRRLPRRPLQVITLFVTVAAVKVANLVALYAALWAFDGDVRGWRVAVAYLVGATSAEVVPTPGGLGAVDAALVVSLVGAGVGSGTVLAGVLVYRLLAFWAPIVPGVLSSAMLRRRLAL